MENKFPILEVTKASLNMPSESWMDVLKAFGIIVSGVVLGSFLMGLVFFAARIDMVVVGQFLQGNMTGAGDAFAFLAATFVLVCTILFAFAYIFNFWVRFAAFGEEGAAIRPYSKAYKAAAINMVKFLLIGLITVLVSLVIQTALSAIGLTTSFIDQMSNTSGDIATSAHGDVLLEVLSTITMCIIYSLVSANLTQTAVGSDKEGLEHPHTVDFAIVLVLLYSILMIPMVLASLAGWHAVVGILQYTVGFYIMFTIAVAHGLRYRICLHETAKPAPDTDSTPE
ncbi:hypothetical protein [Kordiimonas pumila]|uniref:Uncharacterized protein n=1 Tax=Kordiimonas pumila TaxID=2161677 RepID=A0ABV7D2D8_9PROT|nr:hypothetical protein [Kordiimonas pumila]